MNRRQFLKVVTVTAAGVSLPLPFVAEWAGDLVGAPVKPAPLTDWREDMLNGIIVRPKYLSIYGDPDFCNTFQFEDSWKVDSGTIIYTGGELKMVAEKACFLRRWAAVDDKGRLLIEGEITTSIFARNAIVMMKGDTSLKESESFHIGYFSVSLFA